MTGVYQPEMKYDDDDRLTPVRIEHLCEEIHADGALEQKYNYLAYHFEMDDRYLWARAYLDEIDKVSIFGPFDSEQTRNPVSDGAFENLTVEYFKRRFDVIEKLSEEAGGYVVVWKAEGAAGE
ncbi:hypothetical protein [Hyphococcus sp.]|jgi:hypothetical protein|uniref:hypothetical protein n=1 Tax=Hyphococcus sp. TaxID=2038636 RepID=UPI003D0D621E